jgi:xylitol oxidase
MLHLTIMNNWAGNLTYSADRLIQPSSAGELRDYISKYGAAKVLGTRHCFNDIADAGRYSTDRLLSFEQIAPDITLSSDFQTVTLGAGVRYGELARFLQGHGLALHNLASLPHISVVGACATATHGSGSQNGNLATAVSAMQILTASGELVEVSREKDGELFNGMVVHLGGLGIVTRITLEVEPTYLVRQDVYEGLPFSMLDQHFETIMGSGYSVSLFADWQQGNFFEAWVKRKVPAPATFIGSANLAAPPPPPPDFFGAAPATRDLHPIPGLSADCCTEQMGVPGPWHERLPHFKMGFTPSSGEELQSEYFVSRENAYAAIKAVEKLKDLITPYLLTSEIRTIGADPFWMSPCNGQPCATIHFTWKRDWPAVSRVLPLIEQQLESFNAKPHWGKVFTMPPGRIKQLYPRLPDFRDLMTRYDPKGYFRNAFLERNFFQE